MSIDSSAPIPYYIHKTYDSYSSRVYQPPNIFELWGITPITNFHDAFDILEDK